MNATGIYKAAILAVIILAAAGGGSFAALHAVSGSRYEELQASGLRVHDPVIRELTTRWMKIRYR